MNTLAIIGSAGQRDDAARLSRQVYGAMRDDAAAVVERLDIETVVSGGAAFADHVAVDLFLTGVIKNLILFLPCRFTLGKFAADRHSIGSTAETANNLHAAFKRSCGVDGLMEIDEARKRGAVMQVFFGFKRRNLEVAAACTHMQAYTFGPARTIGEFAPDDEGFQSSRAAGLKDGGTAHTWTECWNAQWKRHANLFKVSETLAA